MNAPLPLSFWVSICFIHLPVFGNQFLAQAPELRKMKDAKGVMGVWELSGFRLDMGDGIG